MKNLLLLIISITLLSLSSFGQNNSSGFAPLGAEWWTDGLGYSDGGMTMTIDKIEYARSAMDTVYKGQACKKILRKEYSRTEVHTTGAVSVNEGNLSPVYLYETNDTVFAYNKNFDRFTPLYVFNVSEGDTVCLPVWGDDLRPNLYAGGDTCFCFVIDSVRNVLYDTVYLPTYFEHSLGEVATNGFSWNVPVENWTGAVALQPSGVYAHSIGSLFNGFFPIDVTYGVARPTLDSFIYQSEPGFRCYQDSAMAIHYEYNDTFGCLFDTTSRLSIQTPKALSEILQVYPNPAYEIIYLRAAQLFPSNAQLWLWDALGRKVKSFNIGKGGQKKVVPIADLASGLYYLQMAWNHQLYGQKILISRE